MKNCAGPERTGRSARMLFEVLGDMWVVTRNPYLQDDLQDDRKRRSALVQALSHRLDQFEARTDGNDKALRCWTRPAQAVDRFASCFEDNVRLREKVRKALVGSDPGGQCGFRRSGARLSCHRCHRLACRDSLCRDHRRIRKHEIADSRGAPASTAA